MIPETVTDKEHKLYYADIEYQRTQIKRLAEAVNELRKFRFNVPVNDEVFANATLAYRHLEDASMRLGKVLQALDGGVSVYDKTQVPSI